MSLKDAGIEAVAWMLKRGRQIDSSCACLGECVRDGNELVGHIHARLDPIEKLSADHPVDRFNVRHPQRIAQCSAHARGNA